MRFFGYYALHSFLNQLRKLCKTWVLVFFIVCILVGVIVGITAAKLEDNIEANAPETTSVETEQEDDGPPDWLTIDSGNLAELGAGALLLALFSFEAISADKNGGKIFLPADVNLLFPSPMQPQSVLMFRLAAQLGTALLATIWLLFQLPNLILNLGLSGWAACGLLITWFFALFLGKLLQVLLYILCSTNISVKKYLSPAVYAVLLAVVAGFAVSYQASGLDPLQAADAFFNSPASRWIPLWGWLKGFTACMAAGQLASAGIFLLLTAGGTLVLLAVIYRTKADFYEDAMAKSEETAALMEKARSEKMSGVGAVKQRTKDRSERLLRDGLHRGSGASIFLWKTLYNRKRFAWFGFLTKTMLTYLTAGIIGGGVGRYVLHTDLPILVALPLGALVFFRAMGNPLAEDTAMDFFRMIPESAVQKLLYSVLGGTISCLLDLIPGMLAGAVMLGCDPILIFLWLPVILSVDFYAASVVSFIDLSVPASTEKTIKTLITILFIYFGLLPDIGILAFGITAGHTLRAAIIASAVNLGLGFGFLCLASVWLEPGGRAYIPAGEQVDIRMAGKHFSRAGFALAVTFLLTFLLQMDTARLAAKWFPEWLESDLALWLITFVPQYLIAMPLGWLILTKLPSLPPEKHPMGSVRAVKFGFIAAACMVVGNLVGTLINLLTGSLLGKDILNPLESYVSTGGIGIRILFIVVLAPILEEYLFRKLLIDKLRVYGGRTAVIVSALLFGLFHGNFSQFFYAFALGLAFGYIYLVTGRLRSTVIAHMIINFLGSIFSVYLAEQVSAESSTWLSVYYGYLGALIVSTLIGVVLLVMSWHQLRWPVGGKELPRGSRFRTVWCNPGMLFFSLLVAGFFVYVIVMS